jgi:cyclophilin family peptidyl-prolyl cis-trans isomerase
MRVASFLTMIFLASLASLLAVEPLAPPTAQPVAAATPQEAAFQANFAKWKPLIAEIGKLQSEFQTISPTDQAGRTALVQKFEPLRKQAMDLAPVLRKSAEDAYQVNPTNKEVADLVFEFFASDFDEENNKEAWRMATMLRPNMVNFPDANVKNEFFGRLAELAWRTNDFATSSAILHDEKLLPNSAQVAPMRQRAEQYDKLWAAESAIRDAEAKADDLPRVKISTTKGDIVIELFENEAPNAVANFISLVEKKFYDGIAFHRVLPGFMAQGGDPLTKDNDPRNDGTGGPGYTIKCECTSPKARMHFRGSLSMAHAGLDTGGSQFFLTFVPTTGLDGKHTVFGRVIEGFDVLDKLQRIDPQMPNPNIKPDVITSATVIRKRNHEYVPVTGPNK